MDKHIPGPRPAGDSSTVHAGRCDAVRLVFVLLFATSGFALREARTVHYAGQ